MPNLRFYQQEAVEALFSFYNEPRKLEASGKPERKNALVCLPTGTGKSLIIAEFLRRAFELVPGTRAIMSTHIKTLIEQNAGKMLEAWPSAPLGIYSAGLTRTDFINPIVFGGVQSMAGKFPKFGHRDFLIIDEAHLVGNEGRYLKFINELLQINPYLKIIGLSATAWRSGLGCLTNGKIFTDIVYDLCNIDGFNRLIAEGFICQLISPSKAKDKTPLIELNTTDIAIVNGEFNQGQLQDAVRLQNKSYRILAQAMELCEGRKSGFVFAVGIEDAEEIGDLLNNQFQIPTVAIHSKKTKTENEQAFADLKSGKARIAVSMGMLTTGIDHPPLDFIVCMRPTMSAGLWVQMLGRGTRPYDGKPNCLVLDHGGNTRRLGPINDPVIPKLKKAGTNGDAPCRICPECSCYNYASARTCFACGTEFTFEDKRTIHPSVNEILISDVPNVEMIDVRHVVYTKHISYSSGKPSIKASYFCGLKTFYDWFSVEGTQGRIKGRNWFRQHYCYGDNIYLWKDKNGDPSEVPLTDEEVLKLQGKFRAPKQIRVWLNRKLPGGKIAPQVLAAEF